MNAKIPRYLYTSRNLLMAGVSSSIAFCVIIFVFALFELYNFRHHSLPLPTNGEMLFRIGWICVSYFLATAIAYFARNILQKCFPAWFVISFLGSIIFALSAGIYNYLSTIEEIKNYEEPVISFGGQTPRPILQTSEELIWSILILALVSFLISGLASFIFPYIYNALPRREEETFLNLK